MEYISYLGNNFIHYIREYKSYFNPETMVNKKDYLSLQGYCNDAIKVLEEVKFITSLIKKYDKIPVEQLINWIINIEENLFNIVAESRRPWKSEYDLDKNEAIANLLKYANKIKDY